MDVSILADLKTAIDVFRSGIALAKEGKDLLPPGPAKDGATAAFEKATTQVAVAEATMAKGLGYQLCQCQWPPQIMLLKEVHPRRGNKVFVCQACKRQEPPQAYFDRLDLADAEFERQNRDGDWLSARL
jgi:hypothetical protein